ncbi:methyltransferase [Roseibium aggregatum]|uniref:Methyltransferase domain-containing protein n=1 Tax=Roseibium aggregatum TaxID=187304 RepID=A0A939EDA7_9HYPH|nr:methyltransferase [Roseibium aggregatum]MBN9671060.1 methyltransferase domain-containing protein [Roseibium aggregatum]
METEARLAEGIKAHQNGDVETALSAYKDVLSENPDHPDGLHFLGLLLFKPEEPEDAIALIRHSLKINGRNAAAHNNLGNIFKLVKRPREALEEYIEALDIDAHQANVWRNIGIVTGSIGEDADLLDRLADLTLRHPEQGEPWGVYGFRLIKSGRTEEGADALEKALTLGVELVPAALKMARYLHALGRVEVAVTHLENLAEHNPDDPAVSFQLAAARGQSPEKAPEAYVRSHFDTFAGTFDEVLEGLEYSAPEIVADEVKALAAESGPIFQDALDLGCGTGLCGPLIRDLCGKLTGLDLSGEMLRKASERRVYDFLVEGEMVAFLNADLPTQFDLCVCVDTLIYLGDLTGFFEALSKALKPGGVLVASVERLETETGSYRLHSSSRFAHHPDYLRRTAEAAGLVFGPERRHVLRMEFGNEVAGTVFHVRKPAAAAQDLP